MPHPPPYCSSVKSFLFVIAFDWNRSHLGWPTVITERHHREIAGVGVPPLLGLDILGLDPDPDFHRALANAVDRRQEGDELTQRIGSLKTTWSTESVTT